MNSSHVLSTQGLTKRFGAHVAVSDISLNVLPKQLHCVIGPNGAGKTTLFNLLTKDMKPSAGNIFLEGNDVTGLRPDQISRRGVGRSYQITSIFSSLSVHDNVWTAVYRHMHSGMLVFWRRNPPDSNASLRVDQLLARVGLLDYRNIVASEMSYGDQRILEIAIALASEPRLLLLDEPMSGLSQEDTKRMASLIRGLVEKETVLMIEHKIDVIMGISDRVTVLDFGKVIADGTPEEIAENPDVRRAYFGT